MTLAYRVTCTRITGDRERAYLSEWHETLALALEAMAAHQQQDWDLVALVPQVTPARRQDAQEPDWPLRGRA